MDLSSVPASASEHNAQRTGAHFTIRSANSPSYCLTRRLGVRRTAEDRHETPAGINGTKKEVDAVTGYQARTQNHSGAKSQCEEKEGGSKIPTSLHQNGRADKTAPEYGTDRSEKPVFESRGRTEWRRSGLPSRSKSLDWRTGARSPDRGTRADQIITKRGRDIDKQAGGSVDRRTGVTDRVLSSIQAYESATASKAQDRSSVSPTLDRAKRGQSLPYRLKSQSGPGSKFSETAPSSSPTGGQSIQSIQERIEKLYGPCEKTAGATFPRRFSSGEGGSPVKSRMSILSPQMDTNTSGSESFFSPLTSVTKERPPGGQVQGKYSEEGGDIGTRSLDRARSRATAAAQIRSARAAGGTATTATILSEERRERAGAIKEHKEEIEDRTKRNREQRCGTPDDVFETNPQNITSRTGERKKFPGTLPGVPPTASVRNKISQFEALTQKAQGSSAMLHKRTFSVPTPLSRGYDGVKKSGSAKELGGVRDKWEGLKGGRQECDKPEEKMKGTGKNIWPERSLSVDEVGLRLGMKDTGSDLVEKSYPDDLGKYSGLKSTLDLPLNEGHQRQSRKFFADEPDFSKSSSPEKEVKRDSLMSCDAGKRTLSEMISPVSDEDKTPTNSPCNSPFISPTERSETATPTQDSDNKSTSVSIQDEDSPPLPRTLAASPHSNLPKGKKQLLDLNAWVAGLNPEYKSWSDNGDCFEDDDESTQKDEDSNYDSDSGESSVTVTSNMSQSDRRSFCVSLADLCNFAGADYESENDSDELPSIGRRSASMSSDVSVLSYVSVMPTEELDKLLEDVKGLGDDTLQDYNDVQVVVLHKEVGVGVGFSVAGGVDQNKPVTVHKVFPLGVAAQQGSIREGDQVLSINGTSLCGSAHWEALRVLRRTKSRDMAVVVLRRDDVNGASSKGGMANNQEPTQTQYETGQRVCLQLQKNNGNLGFTLQGGEGSSLGDRPLTVQKIFQGGPVDLVHPGDEVLEIQGTSMVGMRRLEAWSLIRKLPPGPVDVVLHRPVKHLETSL
ncbi:pro-interleukin-16 [Mugil cephalus]|uniref:pro-interleukin-16 n=1 Tax=Mugil cephalus TaxID=48193 RepID=UPI001FB83A0D|nr:pro-interleukin-16 [Mugil cephalus]XP_047455619.1 pro-interleukin-16 [Mugil cephalus]